MPAFIAFPVNWRSPVTESLSFVTEVFVTSNGREVREARRARPRWSYKLPILFQRSDYRWLMEFMIRHRQDTLLMPAPTVYARMTADGEALTDTIYVLPAQRPAWMVVGTMVAIHGQPYRIVSITGSTIVLDSVVLDLQRQEVVGSPAVVVRAAPWTQGTPVHLVIEARLGTVQEVSWETTHVGQGSLEVVAVSRQPVPYVDSGSPGWDGLALLDFRANWRSAVAIRIDQERESFVSETGPESFFWRNRFVPRYWSYLFSAMSYSEAQRFMGFYVGKRGRARTFYAPAMTGEGPVAGPILAGSTTVFLTGSGYPYVDEIAIYPQFAVFDTSYGQFIRKIIGATESAALTTLTLAAGFPMDLALGDVKNVRPVMQSRFAEDTVEVTWTTDTLAEVEVKTKTLDHVEEGVDTLTTESGNVFQDEAAALLVTEN